MPQKPQTFTPKSPLHLFILSSVNYGLRTGGDKLAAANGERSWQEEAVKVSGCSGQVRGCFLVVDVLLTLTRPDTEWNVVIRHGPDYLISG